MLCCMIPSLIDLGPPTPWPVLPPGIHEATLAEIEERFATSPHRRWLFQGFRRVVVALVAAGCREIHLDGSFVTGKPHPEDFDGCWNPIGVSPEKLDPTLLDFGNGREAQKKKFHGEMFMSNFPAAPAGPIFLNFFQIEKFSGSAKGIILIRH